MPFDTVVRNAIFRPIEAIAFWTATVLPFLYVPLLFVGLETSAELAAFLGLVALNIVAFIIGQGYKQR